jgi:hypothetical protein
MSFVVTTNAGKQFEKPNSGMFSGILADVVDLGQVITTYNGQSKTQSMVRFVWFLDQVGTDGKQLTVLARYGVNLHEKSNLYKAVKQIINAAPPPTFDLESLIGQVRQLFIVRDTQTDSNGNVVKDFANIQGHAPAAPGKTVIIPADYIRDKNKPVDQQAKNKKKSNFVGPGQPQPAQQAQSAAQPATAAGFYTGPLVTPGATQQGPDVKF